VMSKESKKELRKRLLSIRRSLSAGEVLARSEKVIDNLLGSGLLDGANTVALYASADNEVDTRGLFDRLVGEGRRALLPRVIGNGPEIEFLAATDWDSLVKSVLGIPEPSEGPAAVEPEEIELVVVPGVGFDRRGGRMGYGMGCYDRALGRLLPDARSVGIGYDFQVLDEVPMEEHDALLSAVVSERGIACSDAGRRLKI